MSLGLKGLIYSTWIDFINPRKPAVVFLVFAAKSTPRNKTLASCISEMTQTINIKFGTQALFYKSFHQLSVT